MVDESRDAFTILGGSEDGVDEVLGDDNGVDVGDGAGSDNMIFVDHQVLGRVEADVGTSVDDVHGAVIRVDEAGRADFNVVHGYDVGIRSGHVGINVGDVGTSVDDGIDFVGDFFHL